MEAILWQDWLTIRGTLTTTQGENAYLDVSDYEGFTAFIDVKEAPSSPTLALQTAASKQDSGFLNLLQPITLAAATTPTTYRFFGSLTLLPALQWVRWQLVGEATFRIWVAAYSYCAEEEDQA